MCRYRTEMIHETVCKVGDTVVYSKYGGTEITIDGEAPPILAARDALAIVGK